MVQLTDATSYKVTLGILFGVLIINIIMVFIAVIIYINAAVTLKKQQNIGQRLQQECGAQESTEKETERYYVYNAFQENKLSQTVLLALRLLYITKGLTILGIAIAYFAWTFLLLGGDNARGLVSYKFPDNPKWFASIIRSFGSFKKGASSDPEFALDVGSTIVGLIFLFIVYSLAYLGALKSWIQVANLKQYQINTLSSNANTSVNELTESLNSIANKASGIIPGISSPWFSLSLLIAYGILWAWLTNDIRDASGNPNGKRVEKWGIIAWVAIIVLYIFTSIVAKVMDTNTRGLFASVNGSYHAVATKIQELIVRLLPAPPPKENPPPPSHKTIAVWRYFKTWIEAITPGATVDVTTLLNDGTGEYSGKLWKYIQHRSGKEMQELYAFDNANVNEIRRYAVKLRMLSKPIHDLTDKFTRNAIVVGMILLTTISFAIFNIFSHLWSSTGMVIGSLVVVLLFAVVTTTFGWFSSALLL